MKKTVSFVAACILAAGASFAANEPSQQPAKPVAAAPESVQVVVASDSEHDYRLERESCCGPQE